jgi:hypothetical protein
MPLNCETVQSGAMIMPKPASLFGSSTTCIAGGGAGIWAETAVGLLPRLID